MIKEVPNNLTLTDLYRLRSENEAKLKKDPNDFTAKHILTWVYDDIKQMRKKLHDYGANRADKR